MTKDPEISHASKQEISEESIPSAADPDTDERDSYKNKMLRSMRRNILATSFYQLLVALIVIILPYIIIVALELDLFVPIFTIANFRILVSIGAIIIAFVILEIVYAIFIFRAFDTKKGRIIGYIVSIAMMLFPPVGTFFGILFLQFILHPENDAGRFSAGELTKKQFQQALGKNMSVTGLLMIHQPILILILGFWLLSMPLDMAHPIITSELYGSWDLFVYVFAAFFIVQILFGAFYAKSGDNKAMKAVAVVFAVFNISSMCLALSSFLVYLAPGLLDGMDIEIAVSTINALLVVGGIILGIIMNPLGLYFGFMIIKSLIAEEKISREM
ncbi:MAG: hypothetical protein GF364_17760 [Candidatus Lokiarchaeota archaeon]|nr:hypothetical protein [Candidatus Lokiarchaeota archaeon]